MRKFGAVLASLVCLSVLVPSAALGCGDAYFDRPFPTTEVLIATLGAAALAMIGLLPTILCGIRVRPCAACRQRRVVRWSGSSDACPGCGFADVQSGAGAIYLLWLGATTAAFAIAFYLGATGSREGTLVFAGWASGMAFGLAEGVILHAWSRRHRVALPRAAAVQQQRTS